MKNSFDELIELIREKVNILIKVKELNFIQQHLIANGDFQKLLLSLDEGQKAIDMLMSKDGSIKAVFKEVEHEISSESNLCTCQIYELNDLKKKTNMLLEQIVSINQANETAVIEKMNGLRKNIKTINNNKMGLNAYNIMGLNVNSIYFDKTR